MTDRNDLAAPCRLPHLAPAGRTPLFAALRRLLALTRAANRPGAPPVDELVELAGAGRPSRRDVLRAGVGAVGLAAAGAPVRPAWGQVGSRRGRQAARIAVIGAGLAGLRATQLLAAAGLEPTLYTAESRAGGRIVSAGGLLGPGLVTELGGEFIDSGHEDLLQIVRELELGLIDVPAEEAGLATAYHFGSRAYSEAALTAAFRHVAARIAADQRRIGGDVDFRHANAFARSVDRMSLAEYLTRAGARGPIYALFDVAYAGEYGLDIDRQSSLNLLLVGPATDPMHAIFGDSDERYKVRGGNEQIVRGLAAQVGGRIVPDSPLVAVRRRGGAYALQFAGRSKAIVADVVLLCLPFTMLRQVDLQVELPPVKRQAIATLGYGTNAKLLLGFRHRAWHDRGDNGSAFTDAGFQNCWDNGTGSPGPAGGLTLFLGGRPGLGVGTGSPDDQVARFLPALEAVFPGSVAARNGLVGRAFWPDRPWAHGSYACYLPGQWTSIAGSESSPVGNLFFAGEHCSRDFQGYMNGAAQTGRQAASLIMHRLRT
jgi:monoamine oxidase